MHEQFAANFRHLAADMETALQALKGMDKARDGEIDVAASTDAASVAALIATGATIPAA